jgi:hypothetical protein
MNKIKKKTKKYIGGSNNNNNNKKTSKWRKASTYESKSKCSLEKLVLRNKKCGLMSDFKGGKAGSNCTLKNLKENMKSYGFFNSEKNKNFVENYLKKITLKFVGKDQLKLENTLTIIDCLPDIKLLHTPFYKIYKFNTSADTEEFKAYVDFKTQKKDPKILESGNNTEAQSNTFKEELTNTSLEILIEFIVEVIIESILTYERIQKKDVKLEFKTNFEKFIKNIDTNKEVSMVVQQGKIMTHYLELRNLYFKKGVDSGAKQQKELISNEYDKKKELLKQNLINHFKNENTKKIIDNLQSNVLLNKQDKSEKLVEIIFDEKRSSSYLFFVVGMLIFALLTKFNVLAGSPLQSSGTI